MDAMFVNTQNAAQRRLTSFPLTNSQGDACWQEYQPYIIHTQDEYWALQSPAQCHAVAYRTVDNTLNTSNRNKGPFGGGKLGVYSQWNSGATVPNGNQQFEFYNYQPKTTFDDSGSPLSPNLGETGNDYWGASVSGIAASYVSAFNGGGTGYINELSYVPPQIQTGHNKALQAWLYYTGQGGACQT